MSFVSLGKRKMINGREISGAKATTLNARAKLQASIMMPPRDVARSVEKSCMMLSVATVSAVDSLGQFNTA